MKRNFFLIAAATTVLIVSGCGGGSPSQSDMIRLAMERKKAAQAIQPEADESAAPAANGSTPRPTPSPKVPPEEASVALEPATASPETASIGDVERESPKRDSSQVVVANQKPDSPLSMAERRQRTIDNLQEIGQALNRYLSERGCFPTPAIYDKSLSPLLSWRVELLPFLGYEDLYKQFRFDQPWDSPHNRSLLPLIPLVYQSPERFDEQTNYVVPLSSGTTFPGRRGVTVRKIEDGLANTVILLEVDDESAVPWTKPEDYRLESGKPAGAMGGLRTGHFFAVWGDGTVGQIPLDKVAKYWKAMMSIDDGEPFSASQISQAPVAELASPEHVADAPGNVTNTDDATVRKVATREPAAEQSPDSPTKLRRPGEVTQEEDNRLPVPTESARRLALELFREIFQSEYEDADTDEEKLEFVEKIRAHADDLQDDPAGRYVLLDLSAVIAGRAGSVTTALEAAEAMENLFQTDAMELRSRVLESTAGRALSTKENEAALRAATDIIDQAVEIDSFDLATRMLAVALATARRSGDQRLMRSITERKEEIANAESAFLQVVQSIDTLVVDPSDAEANLAVGEYCCFVKGQFDNGLPMLSRGKDASLAHLAEQELKQPVGAHDKVALADGWWEASYRTAKYYRAMRSRAAHWYEQALPELEAGLQRLKAEIRIKQAR